MRILLFWPFFCLLFTLLANSSSAEVISLDGSWRYSAIYPSETESSSGFNQRYGLQWNPQVTRAISFDTSLNYSKNTTTGNIVRTTLSPAGSAQIENDLFFAQVSGLSNQTTDTQRPDQIDRSWEAVLASNWDYEYWPDISITTGQQWLNDNEPNPLTDTSQQWSEFILQWESDTVETYYSYYTQIRDDQVEGTNYDEQKHFARVDYNDTFFEDNLQLSTSGQITQSTTDLTASSGSGSSVRIRVQASQGLAGINPAPTTGALPSAPALIDGNISGVALAINLHDITNIGLKVDAQEVDTLYVYTGSIDPLLIDETGALGWDLYVSDDGVNWQLQQKNPSTSYDQNNFRYQVDIGTIQKIYLKLVVTAWPTALPVPVTEMEAYSSQSTGGSNYSDSQDFTRTLFDINLRYNLLSSTTLNYSLVFDDSQSNTANNRKRIFQSAGVQYWYNDYFAPSFTVNDTTTTNSTTSDTGQRSYSLNIQSIFLPTLESTVGLSRYENTTDSVLQTVNHSFHVNLTAALYPNLDTTLELNTNFNSNEVLSQKSETISLRWTVTSRLRPSLLIDFIAEHNSTGLGFSEFTDLNESGGRVTLNLNWRPSDLVSVKANASEGYGEAWDGYESFILDSNASLIRTAKTTFTIGHRISSANGDVQQGVNANWSWNLSEFLTMQSITSYILGQEENTWLINARLTTRF